MSELGFAVIDLETTGVHAAGHDRVLEIAVVHVSPRGTVEGAWQTLVNPEREVSVRGGSGIRSEELLAAPTFAQIAPRLIELLQSRVLVAHNASFDIRFLLAEFQRCGYGNDSPNALDITTISTMELAHRFIPGAHGMSLADCCAAYGIEIESPHHSSSDAMATAQLLAEYLKSDVGAETFERALTRAEERPWPPLTVALAADAPAPAAAPAPGPAPAEVWLARGTDALT